MNNNNHIVNFDCYENDYMLKYKHKLEKYIHIINGLTKVYRNKYSVVLICKKDPNKWTSRKIDALFWCEIENIEDFNINDINKDKNERVLILKNSEIPFEFNLIGGQEQTEFEIVIGLYLEKGLLINSDLLYLNKFTTMLVRNELKKQKIIEIPRFIMIHTFKFIDNYNLINYYK